jgi:hypothetical protein
VRGRLENIRRATTRDDATRKPSTGRRRDADETDGEGWVKRARKSVGRRKARGGRPRETDDDDDGVDDDDGRRKRPSHIGRTSGRDPRTGEPRAMRFPRRRASDAFRAASDAVASATTDAPFRATSSTSFRRVGDARRVRRNYFHRSARSRDRARRASRRAVRRRRGRRAGVRHRWTVVKEGMRVWRVGLFMAVV